MNTTRWQWRTVPTSTLVIFLLGVFFTFSTVGFAINVMNMGRLPALLLALSVLFIGAFSVCYAIAGSVLRGRSWKVMIVIFIAQNVVMNLLYRWLPVPPQPAQMDAAEIALMHQRLTFSAVAIMITVTLGYISFLYVSITEGRRYFRVHAEMELAGEIHRVLVPSIDARIGGFQFYGGSLPSSEVGGDLIDVIHRDGRWTAYVADVSGHGVAPGVVMGMVKSAARMRLACEADSTGLLENLNSVLYPLTKPEMFVTFAYLACKGGGLEYSLAGHPAILQYHAATKEISEVTCSNLPLGMFDGQQFSTGSVDCAPDDLFLMFTDGLLEVADAKDEEFGLAGVKAVISTHGCDPVSTIFREILQAAKRHGHATDDQSLLQVRAQASVC
jgi:isoprenylcysteine carboxyl methyltransferase (ICMT) family protein YpbQ